MNTTRHQKGYIFRKGAWWYLRYYDWKMLLDGSTERVQITKQVAPFGDHYRSKRSVKPLVEDMLRPINSPTHNPAVCMTISYLVENYYFPHVQEQLRPSTLKRYKEIWEQHLKPLCSSTIVREFRTSDGERLLQEVARGKNYTLSRSSLRHIKVVLSTIFKHAKRSGILDAINPMQDVSIPKGKPPAATFAYSLEEAKEHIRILSEPASTVVAVAAFTGLRRGEIAGLDWANYNGEEILVSWSVWKGKIQEPKSESSKASVAVIPYLKEILNGYWLSMGKPQSGLMFPSRRGTPIGLNNLLNRAIKPALIQAGLEWHGWHAYRRGLATNLYRLGVPDKVIQQILRHANVSTTLTHYVKQNSDDAKEAMKKLNERVCTNMHHSNQRSDVGIV